jgi:hypothetical protein
VQIGQSIHVGEINPPPGSRLWVTRKRRLSRVRTDLEAQEAAALEAELLLLASPR